MIVTCSNCDTSFQLDESRVPEQGIRVRCSRCKEAFFLAHPSASKSEAAPEGMPAAAHPAAPGTTQDLVAAVSASGPGEEEEKWEFNVDPPAQDQEPEPEPVAPEPEPAPAPPATQEADPNRESFGEVGESISSGLALEGEEDVTAPPMDGGSAFGSVDDYSSLMGEDAHTPAAPASDPGPAIGAAPVADAGRYAEAGEGDDLGDPENWDFFGDDEGPTDAGKASGSGAVLGRIALTSAPADSLGQAAQLPEGSVWDDEPYEELEEEVEPGIILKTLGAAGHTLGWIATLGLVSIALVSGFWSTAESLVSTPQQAQLGTIEVNDITSAWVDTARGETLLWVRGELVNGSSAVALLDGILEVSLVDASGQPLEVDPQPAGLAFSEDDVRELPPRSLRVAIDRAAWALSQHRLTPNEPIEFHVLFRDVPHAAVRVGLSIADGHASAGLAADPSAASSVEEVTPLVPVEGSDLAEAPETAAAPDAQPGPSTPSNPARTAVPAAPDLGDELTWGE